MASVSRINGLPVFNGNRILPPWSLSWFRFARTRFDWICFVPNRFDQNHFGLTGFEVAVPLYEGSDGRGFPVGYVVDFPAGAAVDCVAVPGCFVLA
jgi:hypothetical protein